MSMIMGGARARWVLATSALVVGQLTVGCYGDRTADEELLDFADPRYQDSGAPLVVDAGSDAGERCTGTEPIARLLCTLTPQPQQTQQPAVPNLSALLGNLGGLGNVAGVLGGALGGEQQPSGQAQGLVALVQLAGGLANIAQLFNGLLSLGQGGQVAAPSGGQPSLADLFTSFGRQGAQQQPAQGNTDAPSLEDILDGFGLPVAEQPTVTQEPSAQDCANPATPAIQFMCLLQQATQQAAR